MDFVHCLEFLKVMEMNKTIYHFRHRIGPPEEGGLIMPSKHSILLISVTSNAPDSGQRQRSYRSGRKVS
jgi:hypothetical protein